jgi:molecular chaperone GrpE (heat shock protein)
MNERMEAVTALRCAGCAAHGKRVEKLEAEVADLTDRLLRSLAENENLRRRVIRAARGELE